MWAILKQAAHAGRDFTKKVADILKQSAKPVFIIPGDNEWNDCEVPTEAWKHWEKYFMNFEQNFTHPFTIMRQEKRKENFAFVYKQTLVVGINNVGGRIHDTAEWNLRLTDNANWIDDLLTQYKNEVHSAVIFGHAKPKGIADFSNRMKNSCIAFSKPVLYVQGDSHRWNYYPIWLAPNLSLMIVDEGAVALPFIQVTATGNLHEPFTYNRESWPDNAVCDDIVIYPNPATGIFNILLDSRKQGPATLIIKDLTGSIFLKENVEIKQRPWKKEVNISELPSGIYVLTISTASQTISRKIVKEQ